MYFSTYERLGLHVGATDRDVVRATERKLRPEVRRNPAHRANRHAIYRAILEHHYEARDLFRCVARGI